MSKKPSNVTTKANHAKGSQPENFRVLNIVNSSINELVPAECEKAFFTFQGNLRRYLNLQKQAFGTSKRISTLVSFTSAVIGPDAWAVPTSMYVKSRWGWGGMKILQAVDAAMGGTEVPARISQHCCVYITIKENNLRLKIQGPRASFAKIVEQICWLVSVAGDASLDRLEKYLKETKRGSTARSYSETIYTGKPVINLWKGTQNGHCFNVSFRTPPPEQRKNADFVAKSGHCWKTMTGFSIVASGFDIPPRPRQCSGLEAPVSVLRQLLKRGCSERCLLLSDEPLVMFPSVIKGEKGDNTMRLIFAAGSEQHGPSNVIYWHFEPSTSCETEESYLRLESKIRVNSQAIRTTSRHFVGWSNNAGVSLALPKTSNGLVAFSNLRRCPHLELVIPAVTATLLIPGVGSLGTSLGTEKVPTTANTDKMSNEHLLETVRGRLFVLWEPTRRRGWMVRGEVVALLLLREYLRIIKESRVDFFSLKGVKDPSVSAYEVLSDVENLERVYWPLEDKNEKAGTSEKEKSAEGENHVKKKIIADAMDGIYATLVEMSNLTADLTKRNGLAGPVTKWVQKKWSTSLKGWDFSDIPNRRVARIYLHRLSKNPGWVHMAKSLEATFLFADGIGDILEPRAGSCCRYFPTLPEGHNFLAIGMEAIKMVVEQYGGITPANKTIARLGRDQAWVRHLHPFQRPGCQGDHLEKLQPSCFPVQGLKDEPVAEASWKREESDRSLLEDKKLNVYTVGEALAMAAENPNGVVVFGRQPGVKELRDICRRSRDKRDSGTDIKEKAAPTVASASNTPSSSGSSQSSTEPKPHSSTVENTPSQPKTATQTPRTGSQQRTPSMKSERSTGSVTKTSGTSDSRTKQPTTPSAQRTPSTASIRSIGSNPQPRAVGTGVGAVNTQAEMAQSPSASLLAAASNASLRSNRSTAQPQPPTSRYPAALLHNAASNASLRSIGPNGDPKASQGASTGAGRPQVSASQSPATLVHKAASNASLRSTTSATRSVATTGVAARSHESSAPPNTVPTAARKPSSSSIRTASSVASTASGGSQSQRTPTQLSNTALKKTNTSSSHDSASSHSSRVAHNMAAFNSNRQRQQVFEQVGQATATAGGMAPGQQISSNHGTSSAGAAETPHTSSTDPATATGGGSVA